MLSPLRICYCVLDGVRKRNQTLSGLTKSFVTEGLNLLFLCEVVCRRKHKVSAQAGRGTGAHSWDRMQLP